MKCLAIIPARYSSSRFPGKPLIDINGKSMIQRVYEQTSKSIDNLVVATDDSRIEKAVIKFGGQVVLTSTSHKSGTDRCMEAADKITALNGETYDVIVNIQGDEPFIHTEQISIVISNFNNNKTQIASLAKKITDPDDLSDINTPKVVLNSNKEAIYFSRSPIPYLLNEKKDDWLSQHIFYKHIGIYAYRYDILKKITRLKPSPLEIAESLEQNRWIENGYQIQMGITEHESFSIDSPEDLNKILKQIRKNQ